jgi:hypothetical protein
LAGSQLELENSEMGFAEEAQEIRNTKNLGDVLRRCPGGVDPVLAEERLVSGGATGIMQRRTLERE